MQQNRRGDDDFGNTHNHTAGQHCRGPCPEDFVGPGRGCFQVSAFLGSQSLSSPPNSGAAAMVSWLVTFGTHRDKRTKATEPARCTCTSACRCGQIDTHIVHGTVWSCVMRPNHGMCTRLCSLSQLAARGQARRLYLQGRDILHSAVNLEVTA